MHTFKGYVQYAYSVFVRMHIEHTCIESQNVTAISSGFPKRFRHANINPEMAPDLTLQQIADAWGVTVPTLLDVLRQSILGEDGSYSVAALAKRWGCVPNSIYPLIYGGQLEAFAINAGDDTRKGWRISKRVVRAFEERRGHPGG